MLIALKKTGLLELWAVMREFEKVTKKSGVFENRRQRQTLSWVHSMIEEHLHNLFFEDPIIKSRMPEVRAAVLTGVVSPSQLRNSSVSLIWIGLLRATWKKQNIKK